MSIRFGPLPEREKSWTRSAARLAGLSGVRIPNMPLLTRSTWWRISSIFAPANSALIVSAFNKAVGGRIEASWARATNPDRTPSGLPCLKSTAL